MLDTIFDLVRTVFLGGFGLLSGLFVLALLFGKRIEKRWEYEAEFFDDTGKEIGELDIQMSRIKGEEEAYRPHATFVFKHSSLTSDEVVQVYIEDELILEGAVTRDGRVRLTDGDLLSELETAAVGQTCTVRCGDERLGEAALALD